MLTTFCKFAFSPLTNHFQVCRQFGHTGFSKLTGGLIQHERERMNLRTWEIKQGRSYWGRKGMCQANSRTKSRKIE